MKGRKEEREREKADERLSIALATVVMKATVDAATTEMQMNESRAEGAMRLQMRRQTASRTTWNTEK